ncbi:MAG: hypothetical protein QF830_05530 [Rhodospirillales bacterium]|jgi:hypothetical protein|nr:hypothetical protein [Rhodospirillales bacterium]MDP6883576.1 hypothetical protein [Rhodospirillales bacterium]
MVKFLSKALSTLTPRKRRAKKPKRRRPAKPKSTKPPTDAAPAAKEPDVEIETIESLEDELVESPVGAPKERAEPVAAPAKKAARKKTATSPAPAGVHPMTAERRALIQEAMAVHKSKSKLLDELSPEQRRKLRLLAGKALLGE